jgi:thiol-disulfide isomerase/thioredoxin
LKRSLFRILGVQVALALSGTTAHAQHFPEAIDPSCRGGIAKVYDECGSQIALLRQAQAAAKANGKIVLVEFGAEWCVWCHSFNQTIRGMAGPTEVYHEGHAYDMGELPESKPELADEIRAFVEENFVVVSIEAQYSSDGYDVLEATGTQLGEGFPFVFTLRGDKFASSMRWNDTLPGIELRSNDETFYRGFDRELLLLELQRIADAAR